MGLLKTAVLGGKWVHKTYSADTDSSDLAPFHDLKKLWDAKRQSGRLPAWGDFEIRDFEGYYGCLSVEDIVSKSPYNSVFRLWGSSWVDIYGMELTGKSYEEVIGPYREEDAGAFWEETCLTNNIVVSQGSMSWLDTSHRYYGQSYADIVFPLADDHRTVDKYLSFIATVDSDYLTANR